MTSTSIYPSAIPAPQSKLCKTCSTIKPVVEFHKRGIKGYTSKCKLCVKEYQQTNKDSLKEYDKEYRRNNKTTKKENNIKYNQANKETIKGNNRKYEQDNKEARKERNRTYQKENRGIINAKTAKRRAAKLLATPKWYETDLINQLYIDCKLISEMTGIEHHIDHIVPLISDRVCGLHCIANLQILSAFENRSKSNSYWPDM